MQNIPEGLFYWQWASNILNLGMSAAAALPIIMALTLLAGRRGNARLCILGTQSLTRLALGLGLLGPLLGAGLVNGMKSWFTVAFPEYWLFALGALFIVITLFLPKGVIGLIKKEKDQ